LLFPHTYLSTLPQNAPQDTYLARGFLRAFVLLFPPTNKTFDFFGCWNWLMQLYHDKKSKQSLSTKKASF